MFQGLSTALTALYAQRAALDTTGNNIANANTEGYTRQTVEMSPLGGSRYASFYSTSPNVGMGVNIDDIARLRDQFLEARGVQEHGTQAQMTVTKSTLSSVEKAFGEPGDNGIQAELGAFWNSFDGVVNSGADANANVVQSAQTLTGVFNQASNALDKLKSSSIDKISSDVQQLNSWASSISDMNKAIQSSVAAGGSPNDLMDQRDLLIQKMSSLANVSIDQGPSGTVNVSIGGTQIAGTGITNTLQYDKTTNPPVMRWDLDGNATTTSDGFPASITGGEIGGYLDTVNNVLPKYQTQLDAVAAKLINTVNTQHQAGSDAQGNAGIPFFTGTTAKDIAVNAALVNDPSKLAVAQAGGGASDLENARIMADLGSSANGPDSAYRQLIGGLGTESQHASNQLDIQNGVTNSVDQARQAASGVNLDEEMTNLIRYQKSYSAAAKYLTVMDDALGTLIGIIR